VIIPLIIRLIVKVERNHTHGEVVNSEMVKFLLFFSLTIFFVPAGIGAVIDALLAGGSLGTELAISIVAKGTTFLYYITVMCFVGNGFLLL
jgi:hypothetical protein